MLTTVGTPTDEPFFQFQWNLNADGQNVEFDPTSPTFGQQVAVAGEDINVLPAWELGYTGAGVQVAIIAGGFDLTHPDLVFTTEGFSTPLDLLDGGFTPGIVDTTDELGTGLAGIVGARDNGEGIIGIAYGSDIIPLRLDPGDFEFITPTIDAINQAIRFQAGFIQDGDGDGVPDNLLGGALVQVGLDSEGRPILAQDPSLVTDVFLHSGEFIDRFLADGTPNLQSPNEAVFLPTGPSIENPLQTVSIVDAIRETAIAGRSRYIDLNEDGFIAPDEIFSLGSIHVVPAGDDGGSGDSTPPFTDRGAFASSQYNQLANSIYTITVGGIDYDGQFENDATGTFNGVFEGGANVLIVAPTGTNDIDLNTTVGLTTGLVTTDVVGDDGANAAPLFNFEFDGDYFADTDYTSIARGSQYAAAQASAVIALMLEANPNLSNRDVQQILLMSARQADQFDESWLTNPMREFFSEFNGVILPQYATYNLDTDGDGTVDIENAILPNPEYDPISGRFIHPRGFFDANNPITAFESNISLGAPFVYAPDPAVTEEGVPIFFTIPADPFDPEGVPIFDDFGFTIPRFRGDPESMFAAPDTEGLLLRVLPDETTGLLVVSDDPEALPVVSTRVRTVFRPDLNDPEADPVEEQEEIPVLLYEPNGNLVRAQVQAVDDDGVLLFDGEGMPILGNAPGSLPLNGLNIANANVRIVGGNNAGMDPIIVFQEGVVPDRAGTLALTNPIINFGAFNTPLEFANGAGYTVSQGYGSGLEDVTYGHGVLDAELAVQLAEAWETNDLYLDESVTITSSLLGGTNPIRLQPAVNINVPNGGVIQTVPGGIAGDNVNINTAFYEEFFSEIETTEIDAGLGEGNGEVITGAPFFDPDGDPILSNRGITRIPFEFDPSVLSAVLTVAHTELTTNIAAGDVDHLRLALLSPDGTQSELNPFRPPAGPALAPQNPQGSQGKHTPSEEAISDDVGGIDVNTPGDFINDSVTNQISAVDSPDQLDNGQGYTWTTNRHWGELISLQANTLSDGPNGGESPLDGWSIIVENHGFGEITFGGQFEITVHGTKATGNRIQGKIGIDDNAQGIDGTEADENFNFDRNIEFGGLDIVVTDFSNPDEPESIVIAKSVVLDDPTDSVTFSNSQTPLENEFSLDNIYKTVAPDTGVELLYPVVDRNAYFAGGDAQLVEDLSNFFRVTEGNPNLEVTSFSYGTSIDRFVTPNDLAELQEATALGFYGQLPLEARPDPFSYRNFDYSQESFAAGVTVLATQFEVGYDLEGNAVSRAPTGVVDRFVTGADGNYYFDVDAMPEPPVPGTPAYLSWFNDFGTTLEYEISLEGIDLDRILTNDDEGAVGYFDEPSAGVVAFEADARRYNVGINDAEDIELGVTSQVRNLNFLLTVDPAQTNAETAGSVYRDRNGDGLQQIGPEEGIAGVTVFVDENRNGSFDVGEPSAVTDGDGGYSIVLGGLFAPRDVTVTVDASTLPAEFELTAPASGAQEVTATPGSPVSADFGVQTIGGEPAQVLGLVFSDLDQDGIRDEGETGVGASTPIRIYLDFNGNGSFDPGSEDFAFTRDDGSFVIESSITGPVEVRFDTDSTPLLQTAPGSGGDGFDVVLGDGETVSGLEFGAFDDRNKDFGDLFVDPDFGISGARYPTLLSDDGARHVVIPGMFLGSSVDIDDNGFQSPVRDPALDGLGDDLDGLADEDGVTLVTTNVQANSTIEFDIVANGGGAVLNAWIDFNADGDWDDPGEQVFTDVEDLGTGVPIRLVANTPSSVSSTADVLATRFRWGPIGLSYSGSANAGEVEDYLFPRQDLSLTAGLTGDFNGDQVVDQGDYDYWRANFGSTFILGPDGNGNGRVDAGDYSIWRDAYEQSQVAPAAAEAAAPEHVVDLTHLPLSPANVPRTPVEIPQPVTMPVFDYPAESITVSASPLMLAPAADAALVDELLAEDSEVDATDDAVDSALLLLADSGAGSEASQAIEEFAEEGEVEEDDAAEGVLDEVFAL